MFFGVPQQVVAKGVRRKIIIKGADSARQVEITDREKLAKFNVWDGPGAFSTGFDANAPSFIIDWSKGPVSAPPGKVRMSGDVLLQRDS